MADCDASRRIQNDGVVWCRGMDRWRQLIPMTIDAVDSRRVGVDDHLHGGSGRGLRVDVTGCVVTGLAVVSMGGQDIIPVQDRVAMRTRLGIDHAKVCGLVDLHRMRGTSGAAVGMAGEITGVAIFAFAARGGGRADAGAGGGGVAGQAAIDGMDLTGPDKG